MGDTTQTALKGVSVSFRESEFVSILGHSGSGKSTLMNIIGILDRPTEGTYILDGIDVSKAKDSELAEIRNQKIGFIFQTYNLIPCHFPTRQRRKYTTALKSSSMIIANQTPINDQSKTTTNI